ncbi:MAG: hypothetical protein N3B11_01980 [Coriobacteriia bacterium]|nr:hypothetical protein [Coriobacteriia bacterium]
MDYFDVLRRGLKIAWENKRLWVLGFFVAGMASAPNPYTRTLTWTEQQSELAAQAEELVRWIDSNLGLFAMLVAALVFVSLLMFVLSVAAHGALVWAADEAAEGRPVRLKDAWSAGFRRWGRTFMIGACLFVPLAAVAVGAFIAAFAPIVSVVSESGSDAAASGVFGTLCCGFPILIALVVAGGVLVGLLFNLALRHGVLEDRGFGASIRAAWSDVWGKRGVWMMWLVMLLPGLAFGAVFGVVGLLLAAPAAFAIYSGELAAAVGILFLAGLVLTVPQAAFFTFVSSAWTVFFRRMTGREQPQPAVAAAAVPARPSEAVPPRPFEIPPPPQTPPAQATQVPPPPPPPPPPAPQPPGDGAAPPDDGTQ